MHIETYPSIEACLNVLSSLRADLKQQIKQTIRFRLNHGAEIISCEDAPAKARQVCFDGRRVGARDSAPSSFSAVRNIDAFDGAPLNTLPAALIAVGRRYAALHEYAHGSGVRGCLSSLLPSKGRAVCESEVDTRARLLDDYRRLCAAVGSGEALSVQRAGSGRRGVISDKSLIDAVCLGNMPLGQVLKAHGWGTESLYRAKLLAACERILQAMLD